MSKPCKLSSTQVARRETLTLYQATNLREVSITLMLKLRTKLILNSERLYWRVMTNCHLRRLRFLLVLKNLEIHHNLLNWDWPPILLTLSRDSQSRSLSSIALIPMGTQTQVVLNNQLRSLTSKTHLLDRFKLTLATLLQVSPQCQSKWTNRIHSQVETNQLLALVWRQL